MEDELEKVREYQDREGIIDLQYMGVNNWTIKALSILNYNSLLHLNFSRNQVTNETLLFLSKFSLPSLTVLDIHWNNYNAMGVRNVVKGKFPSLQYLYLSGNNIGQDGVKSLLLAPWVLKQLGLTCALSLTNPADDAALQLRMQPLIRAKFPQLGHFIF